MLYGVVWLYALILSLVWKTWEVQSRTPIPSLQEEWLRYSTSEFYLNYELQKNETYGLNPIHLTSYILKAFDKILYPENKIRDHFFLI